MDYDSFRRFVGIFHLIGIELLSKFFTIVALNLWRYCLLIQNLHDYKFCDTRKLNLISDE